MNYKLVAQTIGKLLIVIALAMCFPFFWRWLMAALIASPLQFPF